MSKPKLSRLRQVALSLIFWPLLFFVLFRWFEHSQVDQPARTLDATGAELGRPWQEVDFRAADGVDLHGWFFPADPAPGRPKRAVLLCHGNAGNISHRLDSCRLLLELGVSVFVFDYRGYGRSRGSPSEEGTYQDSQAAWEWLQTKGFAPIQIVLFGESLGGAVAAELALRQPVLGLILVSTFTSIPDLGADLFPWLPAKLLGRIRYDTASKVARLKVPLLLMHSRGDTIIGYRHSESLFAIAPEPKMRWELSGDHNDTLLVAPEQFQEGIRQFLQTLPDPESTSP
jgi:fermentation-respiration switch protein FrsA (DUF1100 family)